MIKASHPKPHMKTVSRYSTIAKRSSENNVAPESQSDADGNVGSPVAKSASMPVRIRVLQIQVPVGNPYDIGTRATLQALRRSGVLTKSGKLGKPFR